MIRFFQTPQKTVIATEVDHQLSEQEIKDAGFAFESKHLQPLITDDILQEIFGFFLQSERIDS